ncbi:MAG TPA: hypothetical protein VGM54_13700 [Chthoniobacter sp.]|jgi:hypothetical protein
MNKQRHLALSRPIKRNEQIIAPVFWVRELRIMRKLLPGKDQEGKDYEIRRVRLKRGLNIVWAPPEEAAQPAQMYEDGLAGHASGKTTFCRVLRFVLGEGNFGPDALRDAVKELLKEAWALAEVFIGADCWLVGRALVPSLHHFALKGWEMDTFLEKQPPQPDGSYKSFVEALEQAVCLNLPSDVRYTWRHLLPWLARDQECRFAAVHLWRNSALSEADAPDTNVADQHLLMRAVLRLLEADEHDARVKSEATAKRVVDFEDKKRIAEAKLKEDEARLDADLLPLKDDAEKLEEKRKLLAGAGEMIAEQIEQLGDDEELAGARQEYSRLSAEQKVLQSQVTALVDTIEDTKKEIEMTKDEVQKLKDQARETSGQPAPGYCPRKFKVAEARGCIEKQPELPISSESPERIFARQMVRFEQSRDRKMRELEAKRRDLAKTSGQVTKAEATKKTAESNRTKRLAPLRTKYSANAARVERIVNVQLSQAAVKAAMEKLATEQATLEKERAVVISLRKSQEEALPKFSEVFGDVVRAVMGPQVEAEVAVTEKGLALRVQRNAELHGSALSTIRVLAFDLAAVVQSIEAEGVHPRFLIHDGPREADLSRVIYERFFLYAERIEEEASVGDDPPFQYILTTTTPPPEHMQGESNWMRMTLNAAITKERFFRADL